LSAFVVLLVGFVLPATKRSNCGGNSAALTACKDYILLLQVWKADHGDEQFRCEQADSQTSWHLRNLSGASWIPSGRLLAKVDGVRLDSAADRRIIMVCGRAYSNVPQRFLGRSPMTHAVAYSTGETGLISPQEFARLDLTGFVDLQTMAETTTVEPNGAASRSQPVRPETN